MDCLSPSSPVKRVVMMTSAQVGKTSVGLNWTGYVVHHVPGPMLIVLPTIDAVKRVSKQRIDPLFEESPALRDLIAPARARDSGNTMMSKEFPGGVLMLTGANSPTGLKSMPIKYLVLDEVDEYPADAANNGDPVELALVRQETFALGGAKALMVSTPTTMQHSRIAKEFERTDQRRYFVPCPQCGDMAPMTWARVKWPEGRPQDAYLLCEDCGAAIDNRHKPTMLAGGEWRPTVEGAPRVRGYALNALYSPWSSFGAIASEFVGAHKDPTRLQVFVNTKLGEPWEDQSGEAVPPDSLLARRESFGDLVPAQASVITVGVDCQDDRLEVQFVGWGAGEESWVFDYRVIPGDPAEPRVWAALDYMLSAKYRRADGVELDVDACCIDSGGHRTKDVYAFTQPRLGRRIWAIKGRAGTGPIPIWSRRASRVDGRHGKVALFGVGVDAAKDSMFARLKIPEPGPGYIHFSDKLDAEYFRQLTGERVVTRYTRGRPVRSWQPKSPDQRLEALDSYVYAMAALHGLLALGVQLNSYRPLAASAVTPQPPPPERQGWMAGTRIDHGAGRRRWQ